MKLIIEIPKGEYDEICKTMIHTSSGNPNLYFESKIANGTPIPDNATNGDILKTIFSDDDTLKIIEIRMKSDWLNAPYQKGGKE